MAKARFAFQNLYEYSEKFFDWVFQESSAGVFTDKTAEARSVTAGDFTATGAVIGQAIYFGMRDAAFKNIRLILATIAAGGTRTWKYSNAGSFTDISTELLMVREQNKNFTAAAGYIVDAIWSSNMTKVTVNGKRGFWLKIEVATTTNSPVFSQASIPNLIASGEELVLPVANAGKNSPSDVHKSRHETIEITRGRNDKLNYNDGGNLTITLTSGVYRAAALASHIETLLGAGYTVTFNSLTGYTFTKASGTFQLLCRTGANKSTSVFPTLGFDCSSDKTGALTYTTSYIRKSSGGTFTITAANKNFQWTGAGARNIDLTEGIYSVGSLQSMVMAAMDTADSLTTYDIAYDEETFQFTFKRAGGNITITAGTFLDVVGLAAAGAAASHTGDPRIHTEEWIIAVNQDPADDVFIFNHNFTSDLNNTVEDYDGAGGWTANLPLTYDEDALYADESADATATIIKFTFEDKTNEDGYVQVGLLLGVRNNGAPLADYFEITRNIKENPSETSDIFEDVTESSGGQVHATFVASRKVYSYEIYAINTNDKALLKNLQAAIGTGSPFLFIPDHDKTDAQIIDEAIWGRLASPIVFKEVDKAGLIHEVANLTIIEFI